jgi:hypothetical protein
MCRFLKRMKLKEDRLALRGQVDFPMHSRDAWACHTHVTLGRSIHWKHRWSPVYILLGNWTAEFVSESNAMGTY